MSTPRDFMMHVKEQGDKSLGDIMSTLGMFSTLGDIMMHMGEQGDKSFSIYIESRNVLNTPRCTHDIPLMYSWYPRMHHDIP